MKTSRRSAPARERAPAKTQERDLAALSIAGEEEPLWAQFVRIGGRIDPATITGIIREADVGRTSRLVDLAHECRQKDGHLHSILQRREQAIAKIQVQCTLPEGAKKRDKKGAGALERALRKATGFRQAVAHLLGESLLFGHATVEVVWGRADGLLVPVEFHCISARRFGFRMSDGKLLFDPTMTGTGDVNVAGVDLIAEHTPGKFVQLRRRVNGDVPVREGLSRVLVWLASFRTWDIGDWLKFAEIAWKPLRKGGYMKGASKEDIAAIENALRFFTAQGWVRYNKDTTTFEVEWPKNNVGGQSTHKELAEFLGMEMSKAVLSGTLTTEAGQKGARSLGEVHQQGLDDVVDSDEQAVSEAMTSQLSGPFAQMNYGPKAAAAIIGFPHGEKLDLLAFAQSLQILCGCGLKVPASHVREQTGIPEPNGDEEVLQPLAAASPTGAGGEPSKPDPNKPDQAKPDDGKPDDGKPAKAA